MFAVAGGGGGSGSRCKDEGIYVWGFLLLLLLLLLLFSGEGGGAKDGPIGIELGDWEGGRDRSRRWIFNVGGHLNDA